MNVATIAISRSFDRPSSRVGDCSLASHAEQDRVLDLAKPAAVEMKASELSRHVSSRASRGYEWSRQL